MTYVRLTLIAPAMDNIVRYTVHVMEEEDAHVDLGSNLQPITLQSAGSVSLIHIILYKY